jgi:type VI protein secretion system component Hcp
MRSRIKLAGVAVAMAAGLGVASADAASAEDTGSIPACVSTATGLVRMVGAGEACAANERRVSLTGTGTVSTPVGSAGTSASAIRGGIVLDGVTGEGQAVPGGIDVIGYSDGVNAPAGATRATFTDLQISGVLDAAYPVLFLNAATGRHLRTAVLTVCTDANKCAATAFVQIELADVVISHVVVGGNRQVEFSLVFQRITWKFLRDGTVVSQAQFDVATNSP